MNKVTKDNQERDCSKCGEIMVMKSRLAFLQWIFGSLLIALCTISTIGVYEIKDFKEKFWEQREADVRLMATVQANLLNHVSNTNPTDSTRGGR